MNIGEFEKERNEVRQFFLSELKDISEHDLAMIVELMRAAHHIQSIRKMTGILSADGLGDDEGLKINAMNDALLTMILNITAAQMREALKLLWKFSETEIFKAVRKNFRVKSAKIIDSLLLLNEEFKQGKGFIREVLEPVRNLMFHYQTGSDIEKVVTWTKSIKEAEKGEKPPCQTVKLGSCEFYPGAEYDSHIFSKFLFWGPDGFESGMTSLIKMWELQLDFLRGTEIIVQAILKKEKIPKRKRGWAFKYFYGYDA